MTCQGGIAPIQIQSLLERSALRLAFPKPVEAAFATASEDARRRESTVAALVGLGIYAFLFYADLMLLRDVLPTAAAIRFGVVTPLGLAVIWCSARTRSPRARETYQSIITVVVAASLTAMELQSESPGRSYHHFGFVEVIVYAAIVQRLKFRYAVATVASITILHLATVLQMHEIDLHMRLAANSLVLGAAVFILVASHAGERAERHRYLMTLLDGHRVAELDRLSRFDPLTGLANRRSLDAALSQDLGDRAAVLLLDVDHFKRYNDAFGHQAGDRCLRAVAQAVLAAAEGAAVVARYGGEEFIAVLDQDGARSTARLAERVRASVQALGLPHAAGGAGVVTASVGVAVGPTRGDNGLLGLIRQADEALYAAKAAGRNRVVVAGREAAPARDAREAA